MFCSLLLETITNISASTSDIHALKDFADPMYGDKGLVILLVVCLIAFLGMYIVAEYLFRWSDSRKYNNLREEDVKSRTDLAAAIMKSSEAMDEIKDEVSLLGTKIDGMVVCVSDLKNKMDVYEKNAEEQRVILDNVRAEVENLKSKIDAHTLIEAYEDKAKDGNKDYEDNDDSLVEKKEKQKRGKRK